MLDCLPWEQSRETKLTIQKKGLDLWFALQETK